LKSARLDIHTAMSDNKLAKTVLDATTLTGFATGVGWTSKKL